MNTRIIPHATAFSEIQGLCRQDPVLGGLYWRYIFGVIEQRNLFPVE
ncbi:MAG: hypothetical protein P9M06_01750 [Candidatus Saelkia tenebricola]|nr:hypothetical protein [Candidatus Saelkia tenebricola]